MIARRGVADLAQVAVVVEAVAAVVHDAALVQVGEFQVAGVPRLVVAAPEGLLLCLETPLLRLLVGGEKPYDVVTPDLTQLHAFVVGVGVERGQGVRLAGVFGDDRLAVPEREAHAVVEGFVRHTETVGPAQRNLETAGAHVGVVAVGRRIARHGRQLGSGDEHVGRLLLVDVAHEAQAVVQQVDVQSEVDRRGGLPREVCRQHGRGRRGVGALAAVDDHAGLVEVQQLHVLVGRDVAVAGLADREAPFDVVDPGDVLHKVLLRHPPAHGGRREEAPAFVAREFRAAVVAAAQFREVFALVGVAGAVEDADEPPVVAVGVLQDVVDAVHQRVVGFAVDDESVAAHAGVARPLVFDVPSGHDVQRVVFGQPRGEREVGVAAVVLDLRLGGAHRAARRIGDLDTRTVGVGDLRDHVVLARVVEQVGVVGFGHQHVLDQVDGHDGRVLHVELEVVAVGVALGHVGVTRVDGRRGPRPVGVGDAGDRESLVFEVAAHQQVLRIGRRLVVAAAHEVGVVLHGQPFGDVDRTFGPGVQLAEFLVADAVDAVLLVIAGRSDETGGFAAARNPDVVLVGRGRFLVEEVVPVGVASVILVFAAGVEFPFQIAPVGVVHAFFVLVLPALRPGEEVVDARRQMVRVAHVGGHVVVVPGLAVGLVFRAYGLADDRNAAAVIDRNLILAGAFRRHQHHAERTPGAVYGRRGGVLEHRDALHVLGIHRRQVALHAVDQAERRSACADRLRVRTDVDRRRTARLAVGHRDVQARNLALDRPEQIGVGAVFEHLARNVLHGPDDVAPPLGSVSHDDDLVHQVLVLGQDDLQFGAGSDLDALALVAQIGDGQHVVGFCLKRKGSLRIGRSALRGAFDEDGDACERLTLLGFHGSGHGLALGEDLSRRQHQEDENSPPPRFSGGLRIGS